MTRGELSVPKRFHQVDKAKRKGRLSPILSTLNGVEAITWFLSTEQPFQLVNASTVFRPSVETLSSGERRDNNSHFNSRLQIHRITPRLQT